MKLTGHVDGLGALAGTLARIADEATLRQTLAASADGVLAAAKANLSDGVPPETRSGALARSLFARITPGGAARIGTPLAYGWHLEMGSETRAAYPWLAPALDERRAEIAAQLRDWLALSARRAGR